MKKCSNLVKILAVCIFSVFAFVGCKGEDPCAHIYDNACDVTCNVCSEERAVGAHEYEAADCDTPKTCTVCGATEGEANGHTWVEADCDTPKTCSVCQATEGEANGHTWVEADCDTPKTCSVCQETEGKAKGHEPNEDDGDCTTAVLCGVCEEETTKAKESHEQAEDDGDCTTAITCVDCNYVFVEAKSHNFNTVWNATTEEHFYICLNEGCKIVDALGEHTPEEDDGDCTTSIKCSACEWTLEDGNESHEQAEDDYDCTTAITCVNCDYVFVEGKEHDFYEDWHSVATHHMHGCLNDNCLVADSITPHSGEDDGDCTTWVLCECGWLVKEAKESHEQAEDDGDCTTAITCAHCDYVFVEAKSHEFNKYWNATSKEHWHICLNEGCKARDSFGEHTPEEDDGDCTTSIKCSACKWTLEDSNESHTPAYEDDGDCMTGIPCVNCDTPAVAARENHTTVNPATCQTVGVCDVCETIFQEIDENNHAEEQSAWCEDETKHAIGYQCCGTVLEYGAHNGEATCRSYGYCTICEMGYAEPDPTNHAGEETYAADHYQDGVKHGIYYSCCGAFKEDADHVATESPANCQYKAICDDCGSAFGELDPDNHSMSYRVDGSTYTLFCEWNCEKKGSATINANDKTYDGMPAEATVIKTGILSEEEYTISYEKEDGTPLESAPQNAGTYYAYFVVDGIEEIIKTSFTIFKAMPVVVAPTLAENIVYNSFTWEYWADQGSATGGTMEYKVNESNWLKNLPVEIEAGEYVVSYRVVGGENYYDVEETYAFTAVIERADLAMVIDQLTLSEESVVYDGTQKTPDVTTLTVKLRDGDDSVLEKTLIKDKDFTVEYLNNIDVGTAEVVITGIGNYQGTITKLFEITPLDGTGLKITLGDYDPIYSGAQKTPPVLIEGLALNRDYEVTYGENKYVGEGTVTITFKGNYQGTVTKTFEIIQDPNTGAFDGEWVTL